MLTPDKIKEKQFQSSGRGSYRAEDVDAFISEVSASYEQMFKENGDLVRKISILAKKVEEYRADEESLKLALLNAQKLADQIVAEAKEKAEKETTEAATAAERQVADAKATAEKQVADAKAEAEKLSINSKRDSAAIIESAKAEAEKIVADANKKSDEILGNINRKVTHETLVFEMTKKEAVEFKHKLVEMYKEHINLINQLPDIVDEQLDKETPVSETATANEESAAVEEVSEDVIVSEPEEPAVAESAVPEKAEEPEEETVTAEEPAFEDVYSDSVEETEEVEEEPSKKENPFKLDLSKIDFSDDDDDETAEEVEPVADTSSDSAPSDKDEEDDDAGSSSISFKNFFKKK